MRAEKKHLTLAYLVILLLIANIVLFALKIINAILFWVIIAAAAIFAYKIMPKMNKN